MKHRHAARPQAAPDQALAVMLRDLDALAR